MPKPARPAERNALGAEHSWEMNAFVASLPTRAVLANWLATRRTIKSHFTSLQTSTALNLFNHSLTLLKIDK